MVRTHEVADDNLARQLAHAVLDALKRAGHIVLAPGGGERTVRELAQQMEPTLPKILAKVVRSPIMGEVSSTFGDEATDEAVEELVLEMRETVLDSEGVEDVFAEDRVIERVIFLTLRDELHSRGNTEEETELPPISVRLDTLGYVAKAAARGAPAPTLREALDRAAEAVQAELETFDPDAHTAFFRPGDSDPDKRLEIEAAIEEELTDLVEMGVVELPSEKRTLPLPDLPPEARKGLSRRLDEIAAKVLRSPLCPGSWDWGPEKTSVVLSFTPLTSPDPTGIDKATTEFEAALAELDHSAPPPSVRAPVKIETRLDDADDARARRLLAALESVMQPKPPKQKLSADEPSAVKKPAAEEKPPAKKAVKPSAEGASAEKKASDKKPAAKKSASSKAEPKGAAEPKPAKKRKTSKA